jgi:hypothetical protein
MISLCGVHKIYQAAYHILSQSMIAVLWFDCQVENESNVQVHAFQNVAYLIVNAASSKYQKKVIAP